MGVGGVIARTAVVRSAFAAGLALLALIGLGPGKLAAGAASAWAELVPAGCSGDELITFAPAEPVTDEEMLIAVTSATRHRGIYLTGTARATWRDEFEGQLGWVWTWTAVPSFSGPHRYQFFIDATLFCTESQVFVGQSDHPAEAAGATPPKFDPAAAGAAGAGADNASDEDDDGLEHPGEPEIDSVKPNPTCPGGRLTIKGDDFGSRQTIVEGKVIVGDVEVDQYLKWRDDEVIVLVSKDAEIGSNLSVYLIHVDGYDRRKITINASC
jgi:hypothetical protein